MELRLEKPLVVKSGDRFIVRSYSPMLTIGGGVVLESHARRRRRYDKATMELLTAIEERNTAKALELMLAAERCPVSTESLAELAEFGEAEMAEALDTLAHDGKIVALAAGGETFFMAAARYTAAGATVIRLVEEHHRKFPMEKGLSKEVLRDRVLKGCPPRAMEALLNGVAAGRRIRLEGNVVASPERVGDEAAGKAAGLVEAQFKHEMFTPPGPREIEQRLKLTGRETATLIARLKSQGKLIETSGVHFHGDAVKEAERRVRDFLGAHEKIGASEFKDLIGASRKFAIPLLEYMDRKGITKREGDFRILA